MGLPSLRSYGALRAYGAVIASVAKQSPGGCAPSWGLLHCWPDTLCFRISPPNGHTRLASPAHPGNAAPLNLNTNHQSTASPFFNSGEGPSAAMLGAEASSKAREIADQVIRSEHLIRRSAERRSAMVVTSVSL